MAFRILGLEVERFRPMFALPDEALVLHSARRVVADESKPGFPCRVTLAHADPDERLLLVNFEHQPSATPYRSAHAIYVRESAVEKFDKVNEIPETLRVRLLSVRAFDLDGMMLDAEVVEGEKLAAEIERQLSTVQVAYLHVHFARRGCYAARVDRV